MRAKFARGQNAKVLNDEIRDSQSRKAKGVQELGRKNRFLAKGLDTMGNEMTTQSARENSSVPVKERQNECSHYSSAPGHPRSLDQSLSCNPTAFRMVLSNR